MGKSIIGTLGATCAASVVAPTTFLSSDASAGSEENDVFSSSPNNTTVTKLKWHGQKIPELLTSSDIKAKHKEIDCLKKYSQATNGVWVDNLQTNSNPSISLMNSDDNDLKGCLVVEYYKRTSNKDQKWRGGFRLIWTISNGHQELVTVFNADTDNGKLASDSSIYILDVSGSVKHKKEGIKQDISDNNSLSQYFPQSGSFATDAKVSNYFGFNPEIEKICKDNECLDITEETQPNTQESLEWSWEKDESKEPSTNWNKNFDTWFSGLFGEDWKNIKTKLNELKGTWNLKGQQ